MQRRDSEGLFPGNLRVLCLGYVSRLLSRNARKKGIAILISHMNTFYGGIAVSVGEYPQEKQKATSDKVTLPVYFNKNLN